MDRFWDKVKKTEGCWLWMAALDGGGYGVFTRSGKKCYVHRLSYVELVGDIPKGLVIDHLCRNRRCVNPKHLEAVTVSVNNLRAALGGRKRPTLKSVCGRGHKMVGKNVYKRPDGQRQCRSCQRIYEAERRKKAA